MKNKKNIAYWTVTGLFGAMMLISGSAYLMGAEQVVEGFKHLGYPLVLMTMLGVAKLTGAIILLVPRVPRLKEWAYAGFAINLSAAAISHVAAGDPPSNVFGPVFFLAALAASYN